MTLMLLFGTVGVVDEKLVRFYSDIYERVLNSPNIPFEFRVPSD
jgi:hypothetical protein